MSAPLIPPISPLLGQASPLVRPSSLAWRPPSTQRLPTIGWYPTTRIGILRCQTARIAPLTMEMLGLQPSIHTSTSRVCLEIWLGIWDTASSLGEPAFPMVALFSFNGLSPILSPMASVFGCPAPSVRSSSACEARDLAHLFFCSHTCVS
ncbi:uncharacterized protein EI90DRAFT_2498712 [Cantharellus anzutake]|uniref:uncharacterized protein n=1 Tax=Cantharellus anzutake TaxID=1750568 RepID=UPI00190490D3|nr:uncharacterized protein EI90DRAFT_2498712 [Cantharellus anzutake]KAF8321846.1 hypothetical protein EI90DRAFT_2498712 [Cantharellus anzutake]